jgi:hypothetical protein
LDRLGFRLTAAAIAPDFFGLIFLAGNLLRHIHGDVAITANLTGQAAAINAPIGANQFQFGFVRGQHIAFTVDHANAAFRTAGNALADGFDFDAVLCGDLQQSFVWSDIQFNILWNEFNFHTLLPTSLQF